MMLAQGPHKGPLKSNSKTSWVVMLQGSLKQGGGMVDRAGGGKGQKEYQEQKWRYDGEKNKDIKGCKKTN